MINYLSVNARDGRRTLAILNTEAQDIEPQIAAAKNLRQFANEQYDSVSVIVVKRSYRDQHLQQVEAIIADAIATRAMWSLYDAKGEGMGGGAGRLFGWYCKSPLVDNCVLSQQVLSRLDEPSPLTNENFEALAKLLRLRGGVSQEAARLVLVEGLAPAEAARQASTTPQAVSNVLASCREGMKLVRDARGF